MVVMDWARLVRTMGIRNLVRYRQGVRIGGNGELGSQKAQV